MKIARGERWTLVCAEALAWLRCATPSCYQGLVTDPPYSSGGLHASSRRLSTGKKYVRTGTLTEPEFDGDMRDQRSFLAWSTLWLSAAYRAVMPTAPACVFADWRQLPTTTDAFQGGGFIWRGTAVWTKTTARPSIGRFRQSSEFIVWGSRGPMPSRKRVGVLRGHFEYPTVPARTRLHITEKPVAVMEQIVRVVPGGGCVLDPFAGSGSTGVACLRLGRRFVGVEQDPRIFAIACDRLNDEERSARRAA